MPRASFCKRAANGKRWPDLFDEFIREKPDSPTLISAIYWIGKAKAHEGKLDEAKKISADTIKKYIDDPDREAVELLLTQTRATVREKKKPAEPAATAGRRRNPLRRQLKPTRAQNWTRCSVRQREDQNATARARILLPRRNWRACGGNPQKRKKTSRRSRRILKPRFKPALLGRAGDYLLGKQKLDEAAGFYQQLLDDFRRANISTSPITGLGEIAFQKKDFRARSVFSPTERTRSPLRKS